MHCVCSSQESKLDKYKDRLQLLQEIRAYHKLIIGGNHDFTVNLPMFERKVMDLKPSLDPQLVNKVCRYAEEARQDNQK